MTLPLHYMTNLTVMKSAAQFIPRAVSLAAVADALKGIFIKTIRAMLK